ncbi:TetR/AcrR family transcriptional regulator [Streptomyces sp. NPDC048845]|uniref:TetR/AcrR family transcriptional regulator n=1 Tax=Streptomyces sp. NPDC048845 TaxID=3155390 RepID=UPI00341B55B5
MPTARESLLDAAYAALANRPWPGVRMVDVAAAAQVSRQTLYNEFGSKDGLARALVRREVDRYLAGVRAVLAGPSAPAAAGAPGDRLAAVAEWTVRTARHNPLLRAVLTGCWGERLPQPLRVTGGPVTGPYMPAQRRADGPLPSPVELLGQVRDLMSAALAAGRSREESLRLTGSCEITVRLAVSLVVAPAGADDIARMVRGALPAAIA